MFTYYPSTPPASGTPLALLLPLILLLPCLMWQYYFPTRPHANEALWRVSGEGYYNTKIGGRRGSDQTMTHIPTSIVAFRHEQLASKLFIPAAGCQVWRI